MACHCLRYLLFSVNIILHSGTDQQRYIYYDVFAGLSGKLYPIINKCMCYGLGVLVLVLVIVIVIVIVIGSQEVIYLTKL